MEDPEEPANEAILLDAIDKRITFHDDLCTMEVDFSEFHFDDTYLVNLFYDQLERRIQATGESKWFFLVNLNGTLIEPTAWHVYSRRGRALNLAYSVGSVRFDASEATQDLIQAAAQSENFESNLFASREEALARIRAMPSPTRRKEGHPATISMDEIKGRIVFDDDTAIMSADFSNLRFETAADVDMMYDYIEDSLKASSRRWFFLVDLNNCTISPGAWVRYAQRGRHLNKTSSLGTARYAANADTEESIRMRAESQHFRPNIRTSRTEGLALIEEMRKNLPHE